MCSPYLDYQKINPNTQLMVIGECIDGCSDPSISNINYFFTIYEEWNIVANDPQKKWIQCVSNTSGNLPFRKYFISIYLIFKF